MVKRKFTDSDGACNHKSCFGDCTLLKAKDEHCGTYQCPFYKPRGCKDWVRLEQDGIVKMHQPDEIEYRNEHIRV